MRTVPPASQNKRGPPWSTQRAVTVGIQKLIPKGMRSTVSLVVEDTYMHTTRL
ncbi:rCG39225 [Rattus norvegicus]|uniref:RCG39225 n=1 Tax=Rattus norvegicus TaxID=10116 RepID=A6KMG4_RAT|nr:rCG39225 [Rattus norvegicus]